MFSGISIEALKALDAIDQHGSFAAAAAALYKVPSALTYTIRKLEQDIGSQLFDRTGQRAQLTPAGKLVLEQGRDILLATQRMVDSVKQLESGWESELRIARDTVIPPAPLFAVVNEFLQNQPPVDISLGVEVLGGGWDALHSQRADIVIGASGELPKGLFHTKAIGLLEFDFVVAPEHPLAANAGVIDVEQLRQFPAVVVADTSQRLPVRDSGLFKARQVLKVNSMESKIEAQRLGLGVGFVPRHLAAPLISAGQLVRKPCAFHRPAQPLLMAWRKQQAGKALAWFVERLGHQSWQL
ncbi:LysR family transcriptional regulator [Neiella sp. HB171785]|uniref:LysR family transcriptional regulator n=1 Tax=Neiella litorisoli TaxID=2771431 RepID=A0A8J6QIP6_9GAMM|nr:LysR substrate-binding domain-containing protein [Neiella litorisoli]MBD1388781.1 LysR family transcriptional regulator [Neiella litorisoli]